VFLTEKGVPVRLSAADDEERFREAALRWIDGLHGFAVSLCRDREMADDLVQETYARALAAPRRAPEEGLRVWLFVILHNIWRNQMRRPRLERPAEDPDDLLDVADSREGPEEELERKRLRARLRDAIAALPDSFRHVVVLRCVEEFSYQEVAEIVGCPTGTVMSRLARGRALLRRLLQPVAVGPTSRAGVS
jgi:RNA polymerase sigma-70 factor (ECF subfamily)